MTLVKHGVAGDAGEDFIFVPGDDASGSRDAFIVPERMLPDATARDVRAGSTAFTLRFNRVRARGRLSVSNRPRITKVKCEPE